MANCNFCGSFILFGGVKDEDQRFCDEECQEGAFLVMVAEEFPRIDVEDVVAAVHAGNCPQCSGPGPVDVHVAHYAWSIIFMTSWGKKSKLCCSSCGNKSRLLLSTSTLLFGWWGFPWGFIATPMQLFRNISGLISSGGGVKLPSESLESQIRIEMAAELIREYDQDRHGSEETPISL